MTLPSLSTYKCNHNMLALTCLNNLLAGGFWPTCEQCDCCRHIHLGCTHTAPPPAQQHRYTHFTHYISTTRNAIKKHHYALVTHFLFTVHDDIIQRTVPADTVVKNSKVYVSNFVVANVLKNSQVRCETESM